LRAYYEAYPVLEPFKFPMSRQAPLPGAAKTAAEP
jgi:hypothetical protein